ncbi:hypothetical protein [Mycolicibacterium lutetiense]|uniref:Uncharacterized protein n=1 Tax=Mycolicibacterium lutetiense TaxID=1641992 RepID=A0ABS4ZS90_9MYCO|nr:hypothetical protein [Mycolicibacterium lutetiense]MBP2452375.1 hypothetical protein [Mycolicibacterium lutetiense]
MLDESVPVWTREGLTAYGFEGFVPFAALPTAGVPQDKPGVYCVIRPSTDEPIFRPISPAGHFKGKDQTVPLADLNKQWVQGATVVYIGKACLGGKEDRSLWKRLDEFRRFGHGERIGHSGGKRIWQLADSASLLVGWKETADDEAERTERRLIEAFRRHYGRLPFANMK